MKQPVRSILASSSKRLGIAGLLLLIGGPAMSGQPSPDLAATIAPRDADRQVTDVVIGHPLPSRRFIMGVGYADFQGTLPQLCSAAEQLGAAGLPPD